ncbi:uncharacterized protein ZBAI_03197 [Zygosaccharomyces bailii ISA1307]|nr:uncharacterized protein ZBAI_03197 [Zygosaccharomyces bailii ISA1307]
MSLTPVQMDQVRTKVSYSEVDLPYNGYMDILAKVTKLTNQILKGKLQEYSTASNFEFNESFITELENNAEQKFLELQSSLEVKKMAQENWDQWNSEIVQRMEYEIQEKLPDLQRLMSDLQSRITRVRGLYESVNYVNRELDILVEGRTSLTCSKEQWEKELGTPLFEKLIKQGYLKKTGPQEEGRYRVLDSFTKGPNELKHINKTIKNDIDKLSEELTTYKMKWIKDADIFSKMTSALKVEMSKRDLNLQYQGMEEDEDVDEVEEQEEEPSDDNNFEEEQEAEQSEEQSDGQEEDQGMKNAMPNK